MLRHLLFVLALVAFALSGGCADPAYRLRVGIPRERPRATGAGADVKLTGEAAEALALKVGAVSSMVWLEELGDGSGEYEFVIPCSRSGNVTFSGTSKHEKYRGFLTSFDVDGSQKHNDCAGVVYSGETMTLSGTVNEGLSFTQAPLYDHTFIEVKGTWKGTVVWSSSNGDSGECEVDLALDATFSSSGWSGELVLEGGLDGTFCTIAVDAPFEEWYETQ